MKSALAAALLLAAASARAAGPVELKSEEDKTFYAVGLALQEGLAPFSFTADELELVLAGLREAAAKKPQVKLEEKGEAIRKLTQARRMAALVALQEAGVALLEQAAKLPGAVKTASGLVYLPVTKGKGAQPKPTDQVKASYLGKLADGRVFDASDRHDGPATFPLDGVIPCWTEGLQLMKVGGKARLICPSPLAYGDEGAEGGIPPGATLDFEVELVEILKATPAAAPAPAPKP
jgi:FKBP-type peptidyl-prolyl cis-trans isomerase